MKRVLQYITGLFSGKNLNTDQEKKPGGYSSLYARDTFFSAVFFSNLVRTINWTEKIIAGIDDISQINYSRIFRSTNPVYEGKPFYQYEDADWKSVKPPGIPFNYTALLEETLAYKKDTVIYSKDLLQQGAILEFTIDITTCDGASCAATGGFIDESDIPPIDTWFYVTTTKLYCWIPGFFIQKIEDAMNVDILGSYRWLKDSKTVLYLQTIERLNAGYNYQKQDRII